MITKFITLTSVTCHMTLSPALHIVNESKVLLTVNIFGYRSVDCDGSSRMKAYIPRGSTHLSLSLPFPPFPSRCPNDAPLVTSARFRNPEESDRA